MRRAAKQFICLYKKKVDYKVRYDLDYKVRYDLMTDNLETITVEICKPKAKPFLINTWYRPPNTSLELVNSYEKHGFRG